MRAYADKKYAFVSDYARFQILHQYGGVYFDTDVEAIAGMDDILSKGAFVAWETPSNDGIHKINPGLGLAAEPNMPLYDKILEGFRKLNYFTPEGKRNNYSMIPMVTDILAKYVLVEDGTYQEIGNLTLYPAEFFCP